LIGQPAGSQMADKIFLRYRQEDAAGAGGRPTSEE
jgi:hypothetical protein